jgi:hypothetical protein
MSRTANKICSCVTLSKRIQEVAAYDYPRHHRAFALFGYKPFAEKHFSSVSQFPQFARYARWKQQRRHRRTYCLYH